jgi:hypothetical protein
VNGFGRSIEGEAAGDSAMVAGKAENMAALRATLG